jgi:transposase
MTDLSTSSSSSVAGAPVFVGIDVAKEKLDLARSDSVELHVFGNDASGVGRIVKLLAGLQPKRVVIESTGGLERTLLNALLEAGLPVALVNPGRVRHFAIGIGILAKTDPLDATVLMRFAERADVRLTQKRSENQVELDALITCRRQLCVARTAQGNARLTTDSKTARASIDAVLKTLDKQITLLDQQIRKRIDADDDFKHLDRQIRSVPGAGPILSATFIAELGELGAVDRHEIAALVGVAPFNRDSGNFRGQRAVRGGRAQVRNVLYMATLAAMRFNPLIQRFAQRLRRTGKAAKVVIVACMRKLLTLINAMIRDNLTWPELHVLRILKNS